MILKINNRSHSIPLSFSGLTMGELGKLWSKRNSGLYEMLASLTGEPIETLHRLPPDMVAMCATKFGWMFNIEIYAATLGKDVELENVGKRSWGNLVKAQQILAKHENEFGSAIIELVQEYEGIDISKLPVTEGLGYLRFFTNLLTPSLRGTKCSAKPKRTMITFLREGRDLLSWGRSLLR